MSSSPPPIQGFLWDPEKRKYFKETKELKEKLEKLSFRKKIDQIVKKGNSRAHTSSSITKILQKRELEAGINSIENDSDSISVELIMKRMKWEGKFKVNLINTSGAGGGILDFYQFDESLIWILVSGGVLIKAILPAKENKGDENDQQQDALVQEMVAGLQETSFLIHTKIENGDLIGAVNRERNVIRILPRESLDTNIPEIVLKVKRDISIYSCVFDSDWNCIIGSNASIHFLDWAHGGTRERSYQLKGNSDVLSLFSPLHSGLHEKILFCGSRNGDTSLIDTRVTNNTHPVSFKTDSSPVTCITNNQLISNGYDLFTGHLNGEIKVWDLRFARKPITIFKSLNRIKPFKFKLVDKNILMAANDSGLLETWNISTQERLCCIKWNPNSETINAQPIFSWDYKDRGCWIGHSEAPGLTLLHTLL